MNKYNIELVNYQELLKKYNQDGRFVSENGCGSECASYLVLLKNGEVYAIESDAMEPEDAMFYRDLSFIQSWIEEVIGGMSNE